MQDYRVVKAATSEALEASVNEYIRDGWKPIGGVSICQFGNNEGNGVIVHYVIFSQAMVRP